ncbi:MAG TPA: hypothetical protein VFL42_04705 [Terriglobales bacterium]|nr:hypothetical protein [Terriglobales bacterium]
MQVLLAAVLVVRRYWRRFPLFSLYGFFNLFAMVCCYAVRENVWLYFRLYWTFEAVTIFLGLGIVYEVFRTIFDSQHGLKGLATRFFAASVAVLITIGVCVVWFKNPAASNSITGAVLVVAEATRLIEVGLLMFLFVFSTVFGLHWKQSMFGVALGLGVFVTVDLIAVTMQSQIGAAAGPILNFARMLAFNFALLTWIGYILVPEPAAAGELPKREQLEQWNRAVMEFMHQ